VTRINKLHRLTEWDSGLHTILRYFGDGATFGLFSHFQCKIWCYILVGRPRFVYNGDEISRLSRLVFKIWRGTDRQTDRRDGLNRRLFHLQCAMSLKIRKKLLHLWFFFCFFMTSSSKLFLPTVLSVEPLVHCVVCLSVVVCLSSVCNVLYCGKTVRPS